MANERVRRQIHRVIAKASRSASSRLPLAAHQRVVEWHAMNGEELRLDYELGPHSLVFDVGGYRGQWASDIYARFRCRIHVFEPVPAFAAHVRQRFSRNPDIAVHDFGLGAHDGTVRLKLDEDASSAFTRGTRTEKVTIRDAVTVLDELGGPTVDVMKINIEGGEYELLEHLLDAGRLSEIENIQVQFHDFVPRADERMRRIQTRLQETHVVTWECRYVFENWRRSS